MARTAFDRGRLVQAFDHLGRDLASRGVFLELAVYGGSAIMLDFAWSKGTENVGAVLRPGFDERLLDPSAARVAAFMDLPDDWINDAVGMFTPLSEDDTFFDVSGVYLDHGMPGLRVLVAKPHYLLGMRLMALVSLDRGSRDMDDARMLARELGIADVDALQRSTCRSTVNGRRRSSRRRSLPCWSERPCVRAPWRR